MRFMRESSLNSSMEDLMGDLRANEDPAPRRRGQAGTLPDTVFGCSAGGVRDSNKQEPLLLLLLLLFFAVAVGATVLVRDMLHNSKTDEIIGGCMD